MHPLASIISVNYIYILVILPFCQLPKLTVSGNWLGMNNKLERIRKEMVV
jgi:hypothetical protein